jgi:hypothetical protein
MWLEETVILRHSQILGTILQHCPDAGVMYSHEIKFGWRIPSWDLVREKWDLQFFSVFACTVWISRQLAASLLNFRFHLYVWNLKCSLRKITEWHILGNNKDKKGHTQAEC